MTTCLQRACARLATALPIAGGVACVLGLGGCSAADDTGFGAALARQLQAGPAVIDLATVPGPAWEELFIFPAGSGRDANCAALQLGWLECRATLPAAVPADAALLVFRFHDRIARAERLPHAVAEFCADARPCPRPVVRGAARFDVQRLAPAADGAVGHWRLRPVA